MGVGSQRHSLAALYRRERPGIHCTGGWVGPRAGLDGGRKISFPPGFDPWTVQPVASCYTDRAFPVPSVAIRLWLIFFLRNFKALLTV
jgi:hypothetical protein